MSSLPNPSDLVLVAILPSPRDMEIARMLGWYRIPLRSAPRVVVVDYLAFYQPASFGEEHRWRIEFVAPILGHELGIRADLLTEEPDHPNANQEYYKMQIGELVPLPRPIPADKWKRISFIYTTGERLLAAKRIQDLSVHDEERPLLWKALREKALENEQYGFRKLPEVEIDMDILMMLGTGLIPPSKEK